LLHILYGEDDFTIKESLAQIKIDCGGADLGEANINLLAGSRLTFNELLAACNTISFLAPKRLVIVEGLLSRFEQKSKRGKGKTKSPELKEWESLAELNMPETTVLVLVEGKLSKSNPLFKKLAPIAEIKECVPLDLKGKDLPDWIRARVKANGGEITPRALGLLISFIGNNLWILSNEIEKLCLYTGDRHIEEAEVNLMVSQARETNIFHLVDAIVQRNHRMASRMLHQHLNEGAAPPYLLFMITNEFRLLIQAKKLSSQRLPIKDIGSRIGEFKDWKVEKMLRQAQGYSIARLGRTYHKLLETDLFIKTGVMEGETALDLLIADLCKR
jgi:DNA polymerase-3 subunit delta